MEHTKANNSNLDTNKIVEGNIESEPIQPASLRQMYRYITGRYWIMLVIGIINAIIAGASNPARLVLVRDTFNEVSTNNYREEMAEGMRDKVKWFAMLAAIGGITCYIFCMAFIIIGAKISYELKWRYLKAVLSQDCAWYESKNIEELPTQINVNIALQICCLCELLKYKLLISINNLNIVEVENATGKTTGFIIYSIGAFIGGVCSSFFVGAVLACCYLIIIPYSLICGASRANLLSKGNEEIEKAYEKSGADAEQALMSIRVVKAFGQESAEIEKYTHHLSKADKNVNKLSLLFGATCGMVDSMVYITQAYALLIGGFFVAGGVTNKNVDRTYNMGDILGASVAVLMGALFFGASAMNIQSLKRGLICAGSILSVVDRVPPINIYDSNADDIEGISEDIIFENVSFKYERRNKIILDQINITFKFGKTTALVGPSGCGKSTIIRLLERFYDPSEGRVLVNSKDLKTLNLQQYRRKIGYVGQEPCLLNESIKDNLLNSNPDASDEALIEALKLAQAYDFVMKLPQGIDTDVGGVGSKLSGGQKQRIAIARALLKKPDLLILDEATSALDSENERAVQAAIDNIGRTHSITTVVIAHRLTTIKNSDFIYVLNEEKIVELGNHKSLIKSDGLYSSYFKSQEIANSVYDSRQQISKDDKEDNQNCENELMLENHSPDSKLSKEISSYEIFMKLLPYNKPRGLILVLFVCCTAVASALPIMAIYLTKCLFAFLDRNHHHMKTETSKYCSVIAGMGALVLVLQAVSRYSLQILSFSMTKLVRKNLYKSMINQPIYFYDEKENSTGQLTGILASDSRVVNGASIELYILLYQGLVGITSGVIVGFIQEWNLGLVIFGLLPATCFCAYFQLIVQNTPPPKASKYTDFERTIISDSISNYTTMLSLAYQDRYVERYYDCGMNQYHKMNLKVDLWQTHWFSVIYAASNAIIMGYVIPMIYVMSSNIEDGDDIRAQFIAMNAGILGSFSLSLAMFNAPDYGKGKTSSLKVFRMIESPQEGSPTSTTPNGSKNITSDEANGDIEFHNVWFKYPSSADWVLKNFSFKINGQESVGFVGESGCGKSTVTLLLLRFYEPNKGFVTIGGTRITEFTIKSLRSVFGLVQQEPIIFNCSIMENICYGAPHATAQEIKKAAELANADNFIDSLTSNENPDNLSFDIASKESDIRYSELSEGYRVICGHKGGKLSGGQKQRIAIARALIRNPQILLLDEATSALDEKTQVEVQETLDEISKTTTSIVIAHRKSTLSNCDRIVQIYDGVILNEN